MKGLRFRTGVSQAIQSQSFSGTVRKIESCEAVLGVILGGEPRFLVHG